MTTTSQRPATPVDSLTRIAAGVSEFVDRQLVTAPIYGTHYARLWQLTAQTVVGGKMVRPRLMIDATTALVEDPLIVALAHFEAGLGRQLSKHWRPHVEHRVVRRRAIWKYCVAYDFHSIRS